MAKFDEMDAKLRDQELRLQNHASQIVSLREEIQRLESILHNNNLKSQNKAVFSPRTCQEALDSGLPEFSQSGMYWIDPDGVGIGDGSIYVYCDMTTGKQKLLLHVSIKLLVQRVAVWGGIDVDNNRSL